VTDRPGRDQSWPRLYLAVSFPVYRLDSPFTGPRWLELFGDPPDGPPSWVTLAHQTADGRSLLQMTTYLRRPGGNSRGYRVATDAQAEQGRSPLEDVACQGTTALINLTLPVPQLAYPPGFLTELVGRAVAAARARSAWPMVVWRVDGLPVQVHVWRFAGGWTAFTDAVAGVYLCVVGVGRGAGPEDLSVAALRDGRTYHFDLHGPLSLQLAKASAEAAGLPLKSPPSWAREDWHPDHLHLIRELAPS
jgi:hypothetical protein